jgi:type I restriction enzyme R subunit
MNPNLTGRDIRQAFNTEEYSILLVANKFQTGFDQPLLCAMYVDKRLAGIQAVQTLSRLNRAYPGKDTTYIIDFVNKPEEVLAAFRMYYATAELSGVTDPHMVYDLRTKLDAAGAYDDSEIERVVAVELSPAAKQKDLEAALEPVVDRLLKKYKAALEKLKAAKAIKEKKASDEAQNEIDALILFKRDMGTFQRIYAFLSQIFDYGNTDIEKRHIFFRVLLPLLEFGRERDTIDFSKVVLTHHDLKNKGKSPLLLGDGDPAKIKPITDIGGGSVHEKEKALLAEIIAKVNELFQGELTDDDRLVYVNNVLKGKLLESETLAQQAANNTKEQFSNSPDLKSEIMNAIMDALAAHNAMSQQALNSERVRDGLRDILLGPAQLYEALREKAVE